MRIAFDYQVFCMQAYGGISRYFTRIVEQLLISGVDVKVFCGAHRNFYLDELPVSVVSGRRVNSYPPKSMRFVQAYNHFVGKRAMYDWRPHVVHETYYSKYASAPRGCATVLTVYDMIHELYPDSFFSRDSTTQIKRSAIARADHVICISESTRNDLINLYSVPEQKISVVHLGFEKFPSTSSVNRLVASNERPFILYVGSRSGYKNFSGFLKAFSHSARLLTDFDIIAFGGGAFSVMELSLIKKLGYSDGQVKQIGGNDSVLGTLYKTARAFVYPSLYEGFGLPPLEAMGQSCPVISSNTSSMPEVIGSAGVFFDPLSEEDMTAAIERVVYDDALMAGLRALGQERLGQFSWQRCAAETLSIYQSLQR
jgi:glycosyltransferase involved in cell wall biosynthesis